MPLNNSVAIVHFAVCDEFRRDTHRVGMIRLGAPDRVPNSGGKDRSSPATRGASDRSIVIQVSNGGRQFDTAPAAIDALGPIAEAVGDQTKVIVDGGIRRGSDIAKAIAMGARAVQIARPIVWGLVVDGEDGVRDVVDLLRDELDLAMALAGCRSIDEISVDLLRPE